MQTILKNMRAGQLAEPLFGSEQHEMYLDLMDQQLATEMSKGQGLGFADMLVRQLGGDASPPSPTIERVVLHSAGSVTQAPESWSDPEQFAASLWPHVTRTAERIGVAPEAILAQAALESGWGQHVMQRADGGSSYNLFGIKAGSDWYGGSVVRKTLEFTDGLPQVVNARFRAYPNVDATFDDYAQLLTDNPRYAGVMGHGGDVAAFASALEQAGYATDPHYAKKIEAIVNGDVLRNALQSLKNDGQQPINHTGQHSHAR